MSESHSGSTLDTLRSESDLLRNCRKEIGNIMEMSNESMIRIREQREKLFKTGDRLHKLVTGVPYIGDMVSKIKIKKKKDRLILSSLIGFLMFFIVWYLFG